MTTTISESLSNPSIAPGGEVVLIVASDDPRMILPRLPFPVGSLQIICREP
jgi:hypothetical protein